MSIIHHLKKKVMCVLFLHEGNGPHLAPVSGVPDGVPLLS